MEYIIHSHRHADSILVRPEYKDQWLEITDAISDITDIDLKREFPISTNTKSLSAAINTLIHKNLVARKWTPEAQIFHGPIYTSSGKHSMWRLDFAKMDISIEVAFNHGEATAWNLLKPVIASELNHVEKVIQTKLGIIIFATEALKSAGGFDGAVGTFEKALTYLDPLNTFLTVPIMLIGLQPPKTFKIEVRHEGARNIGHIVDL